MGLSKGVYMLWIPMIHNELIIDNLAAKYPS